MIRDEMEMNSKGAFLFGMKVLYNCFASGMERLYMYLHVLISERGYYGLKDGCIVVHLQAMQIRKEKKESPLSTTSTSKTPG
jgi:hypothetical protein